MNTGHALAVVVVSVLLYRRRLARAPAAGPAVTTLTGTTIQEAS